MEGEPGVFPNQNQNSKMEKEKIEKEMIERWRNDFERLKEILEKEKETQEDRTGDRLKKKQISEVENPENEILRSGDLVFLPAQGECLFIGDIHGDRDSLNAILKETNFEEKLKEGQGYLVFLGDYLDRGDQEIEALEKLLDLKKKYGERVILLRGNHETGTMELPEYTPQNRPKGLKEAGVFNVAQDFFGALPCVLVTGNGICALHGGIPEMEQGRTPTLDNLASLKEKEREQILWNDPAHEFVEVGQTQVSTVEGQDVFRKGLFVENPFRGGGYKYFLYGAFDNFLKQIGANVLIRAHEPAREGYLIHSLFDNKLATIFSSLGGRYKEKVMNPGYCLVDLSKKIETWEPKHFGKAKVEKGMESAGIIGKTATAAETTTTAAEAEAEEEAAEEEETLQGVPPSEGAVLPPEREVPSPEAEVPLSEGKEPAPEELVALEEGEGEELESGEEISATEEIEEAEAVEEAEKAPIPAGITEGEKKELSEGFSWSGFIDFLGEIIFTPLEWILDFTDKILDFLIKARKFYDEHIKPELKKIWKALWD